MKKMLRPVVLAALFGALIAPCVYATNGHATSPGAKQEAMSLPALTLQNWQASAKNEKLSFLFGLATMVELEKEWQGGQPLPISQSLNESWVRGLDGVSLGTMSAALDKYADEHPTLSQMSVLEALGRIYVRPKLNEAERNEALVKAQQIKASR